MIGFFKFPLEDALGGAEFHTLKLAKHFQEQGHQIKLFTSDPKLFRLFEKHHFPRRRMFIGWEPTSKKALLKWPLTVALARVQFFKLLQTVPKMGVFFLQGLTEKLILTPLAEKRGIKVLWLEHKIPGRWLKQNPLLFRYRLLSKKVQLITVSNFVKREFINLGVPQDIINMIHPGAESPNFSLLTPNSYTIGLLSRLALEKGVYNFLKIIFPALRKHPNWKILIAGEGMEREKIVNFIKTYSLESQIRLLGFFNDLDEFFSQISVLVYPSKVPEAFGMAVLEAQARGVPVVATKIGALPEIIEHEKSGFLVEPDKPEKWKEYLEKLTVREIYERISGQALVRTRNFSETQMLNSFDKLLKKLSVLHPRTDRLPGDSTI